MKTFKVYEVAYGTRKDGSSSITLKTNIGTTFVGEDYLTKKAHAIGKTLKEVTGALKNYIFVVTDDYKEFKKGVQYSRKKDDGSTQTWIPDNDNFQCRFALELTEDALLRKEIADSVGREIIKSMNLSMGSMKVESAAAVQSSQPVQEAPINIELED